MVKLDDLISELLSQSRLSPNDEELRKEFLNETFRDFFQIKMSATLTLNACVLNAKVIIGDEHQNFDHLITRYSLRDRRETLVEIVRRINDYILDNCTELVFTTTFTDPTPSNRKRVIYFHEFYNRGVNVRQLWKKRADRIGGSLAGVLTTVLAFNQFIAEHPVVNIGQQGIMWGYFEGLVASAIPSLVMRWYGTSNRVWRRELEYLGKERIVEGETILAQKYIPLTEQDGMKKGVYAGQFDSYRVYNKGSILNLREWQAANSGTPLFHVKMSDNPPPISLIWIVGLDAKIDRKIVQQEQCRAFYYRGSDRDSIELRDNIDTKYVKEVRF